MSRLIRPHLAALTFASLALAACGSSSSSPPSSSTAVVSSGAIESVNPVVVNGTAFTTAGANIVVNGAPNQPQSELKVGRVVRVRGSASGRSGEASEVEIEPIFHGRAGTVTPSVGTTTIDSRGQKIAIDDSTKVVDQNGATTTVVANTSHISVHGFPDDSGVIRATRIEVSSGADDFQLKGYVSALVTATKTFELKITSAAPAPTALLVTADTGVSLPAGIQNGSFVEVRSTTPASSNPIIASSVTLEDPKLGSGGEAEVEGVVTDGNGSSFTVQGTTVVTSAATVFENGVKNDVLPGVKVEAEGTLDSAGVLQARKVSLRASVRLTGVPQTALAGGTFKLLGFTVHVDDFTDVPSALNQTDAFEVRARLHANGNDLVAERIDNRGTETRIFVQGPVSATAPASNTFTMLGLTVNVAGASLQDVDDSVFPNPAAFFAKVSAGTVVKARGANAGALSGTTFTANEAEIEGSR